MVEMPPRSIVGTIKTETADNNQPETTGNMATETTGNIQLGTTGSMCPETTGNLETEMAGNNKDREITGHASIALVTGKLNRLDPQLADLHLR